jgi:hypothetical protein
MLPPPASEHGVAQKGLGSPQQPGALMQRPLAQSEPVVHDSKLQARTTQDKPPSTFATQAHTPSGPQLETTPAPQFSPLVHSPLTTWAAARDDDNLIAAAMAGVA